MRFYDLSKKHWQWITLILLAFVWGSSFILMKKGLRSFDFTQVASFRIFLAFLILTPLYPKLIKKLTFKNSVHFIIAGYTGIFFPAFLFTKAQVDISSLLAGMINSLAPFFSLIIGVIFFRNAPKKQQYLGVFLGLIGAVGLISSGNIFQSFQNINSAALYVVLATFFYGINANEVRFKLKDFSGVEVTALAFLFTGPVAGFILLFSDFSSVQSSPTMVIDFGYIFILALIGSVLSLFFFNSLVHYTSALFATSVTYIIPFFAILWGLMDNESISYIQIMSMVIVFVGVWLINKKTKVKA